MDIKEQYVDVFGTSIYTFQLTQKGRNEWVILLHDALGSVAQWKNFPELLFKKTRCNILLYDRAGYGKSKGSVLPRSIGFMHEEAKTNLPELLNKLEIKTPLILGHSDGGSIALMFAEEENCKAVISIAAHAFVEDLTVMSIKKARIYKDKIIAGLAKYHTEKAETIFFAWNDTWVTDDFKKWNIWDATKLGKTPVLLVQGDEDEYGTWKQIEDISAKAVNPKVVKLGGVGHMPHLDCPKKLADKCAAFIEEVLESV